MESFDKWPLLARVNSPADVKALSQKELAELATEIRDYLVFRVGENGGHLASNLGVVELTLALHRVFDSPTDHIIFDVGHQSYVHKLLTGRKERFDTLRQAGGLSGFTKRAESEHDPFGAGHSSTAISAAIGMAQADALAGKQSWTVAVVGDGALTGGLSYEGLNNCPPDLRVIFIINENEMSISPNTGRLAEHLSHLRASRGYIRTKERTKRILWHIPLLGKPLFRLVMGIKRKLKHLLYHENLFEHMGIFYLGPIDGNDAEGLEAMLAHAKRMNGSVILHVKTAKGKGCEAAERDPNHYHALQPCGKQSAGESFSLAMGNALCSLAEGEPRICAITAAMRDGTGLVSFAERYPARFFDVGIAEGHAMTFAAGLAAGGNHPVVALYSTFLQRAYDHILHDVALQGLPLTLCIDRAGLNAGDGATHHGIFDVAMLSALPQVQIFTPVTAKGVERSLQAALAAPGITAIRYPAGAPSERIAAAFYPSGEDKAPPCVRVWECGEDPQLTVITYGRIAAEALSAAERLQKRGVAVRVLLCEYIAPYRTLSGELAPLLAGGAVLFLEEEIRCGGFAANLTHALLREGCLQDKKHAILACEDPFVAPKEGQTVWQAAGVDAAVIEKEGMRLLATE